MKVRCYKQQSNGSTNEHSQVQVQYSIRIAYLHHTPYNGLFLVSNCNSTITPLFLEVEKCNSHKQKLQTLYFIVFPLTIF